MKIFEIPFLACGMPLYEKPDKLLDIDLEGTWYYGECVKEEEGKFICQGYGIYSKLDKKGKIAFIS